MTRTIEEAECRARANSLLDDFMVGAPEEIDLETIAWRVGKLVIETGSLDTADGRLVATTDGGTIRIGAHVSPEGRRRFTVAHEVGHYCLHGPEPAIDTAAELSMWHGHSKEAQANIFAGELLMPEWLMKPRIAAADGPSLAHIDSLAAEFRTSNLAAAVHYVMHTEEPCALIVSKEGKIQWFRRSRGLEFFVRRGDVHQWSAAGEIYSGKSCDTERMVSVPAGVWLDRFEPDGKESIKEDARSLPSLDMVVSLIWIDEAI